MSVSIVVLHVLDHSIPLHSGYTFRSVALLREQRRLGWRTEHLTSPKQGPSATLEEAVDGWRFFRTPPPRHLGRLPGWSEWSLMRALESRIEELARQFRPQLIHAHSPVLNALPAIRVARRLGVPVVYEVRAFWEDAAVDHGTTTEGSLRYRLTRRLETHALRRASHVFTICEGLRQDILGRGIPADRVGVVPNGVDIDAFKVGGVADAALKEQLGLAGAEVIGFIGSFYAYEGLDLLLEALPALLARRPMARVLLVGGGPQEAALKRRALDLNLADKVVFTGRVPHDAVNRYYDLVDVLAYPRHPMRLTDLVTPLKPLEAMAQGRLLVASDVGGHKELIDHGRTGVLFQAGSAQALAEALASILERPDVARSMKENARRFVEAERQWRSSAARYVPVYERLVAARSARAVA